MQLTPLELAEVAWLGTHWAAFDLAAPAPVIARESLQHLDQDEDCQREQDDEYSFEAPEEETSSDQESQDFNADGFLNVTEPEAASQKSQWRRAHVHLPQLPALDSPLNVARALHRLASTREAPGRLVINLPLTVQKTASTGVYQLVLDRRLERSTHLVMLIDDAGQLAPWQKAFEQVVALAEEVRSFASFEVLEMDLRSSDRVRFYRVADSVEVSLLQVARTGMEHLVLIMSDGVGAAVSSGALGNALSELPTDSHVACLHPWPRRHWPKTRLGRLRTVLPSLTARIVDAPSILGVPVVPLSAGGLDALERWVQRRTEGDLFAFGIPGHLSAQRRTHAERENRGINWAARARRLAGVLEPSSLRLLTLAAAIPGRVDVDLLYALGVAFGVPATGYSLAEAMTAGFMERVGVTNNRRVVLRFVSDTARYSLLPYLERSEVQEVLDFLITRYEQEYTDVADIRYGQECLQLPIDILTRTLRPDDAERRNEQDFQADREREGFTPLVNLLELAYSSFNSENIENIVHGKAMGSYAEGRADMSPKKRKLIEVALPLDAINTASAREKSIRHGHPSTLHLWWARRPLAAARTVIFAQMVDDPSAHPELFPTEEAQAEERQRLFRIIEELVKWENTTNETVLQQARDEIWRSWRRTCAENADHPRAQELFNPDKLPVFHDPFAGGGSLPLEAQRLGLESYASDLNPVAVLINKAMIEIPPKFANRPPVNPEACKEKSLIEKTWHGAQGLAEDVRYYGKWMRDEAEKRIGHLYPKVEITEEMVKERPDLKPYVGKKLAVITWLWARTVKSPNPAFAQVDVPLAATFVLSNKAGKEVYVEPIIEGSGYRFMVRVGKSKDSEAAKNGTKFSRGANFKCLMSGVPIAPDYIKTAGKAGRMGARLIAIVAEGDRERVYLPPTTEMEAVARQAKPEWKPDVLICGSTQYLGVKPYGMDQFSKLFTDRQLVALTTFSDLVQEACEQVKRDALSADQPDNGKSLISERSDIASYADAVGVYLAFVVSSLADRMSTICTWDAGGPTWGTKTRNTYSRQAIPMSWDFAEVNPLSTQSGSLENSLDYTSKGIRVASDEQGVATQDDATTQKTSKNKVVSTDPPYYDNVPYADLSDFFYVWLRRALRPVYPDLFATLAVPKAEELVAFAYRHDGKAGAEAFFLAGMTRAMHRLVEQVHPAFPITVYYAFKQAESGGAKGTASTGWETFLDAVIRAGFAITGTWPMRTELGNRMRGMASNALASSIVLVCRPRAIDAPTATRREFVTTLKAELPAALAYLQHSNIAPVDLAQSAIGPGMAVYTRYARVLDAAGKPLSVREALALINQTLDEVLAEQEGDFDADSRWALAWFDHSGFTTGEYGVAETLSKAKNTSIFGMVHAGILASQGGKVRLLRPDELPDDWDPTTDSRLTVWEVVHQLIRVLEAGGESAAAELMAKLGSKAEVARELAYRLYTLCERKKRAPEALAYNGLVQSWPEIARLARESPQATPVQTNLL